MYQNETVNDTYVSETRDESAVKEDYYGEYTDIN